MQYFANPSTQEVRDAMNRGDLGAIMTPKQGNKLPERCEWIADNGRFGKGWPGTEKWLEWLEKLSPHADRCLFATAPDVFDPEAGKGDPVATLAESRPQFPAMRALGYQIAFVAQDGSEEPGLIPWDEIDWLFIGGSTEWKLGPHAAGLAAEAKRRGKSVHMGRVNSFERLQGARHRLCDTADGTYIAFGPDQNLPKVLAWLRQINSQADLFGGAA